MSLVRIALEAGRLQEAAEIEARAADGDGYDVTAELLRTLAARLAVVEEAHDWLAKQLDGLIEDADVVAHTTGLALARSIAGNLRDARKALPDGSVGSG